MKPQTVGAISSKGKLKLRQSVSQLPKKTKINHLVMHPSNVLNVQDLCQI